MQKVFTTTSNGRLFRRALHFASAPGASQMSAEKLQVTKSFKRTAVRWDVVKPYVSKNKFSCPVSRYTVLVAHALWLHAQIWWHAL